jgi:hypothetical protein
MDITVNTSAENFMCLQNMMFGNFSMIVDGQNQNMKGHRSLLNLKLETYKILKQEDM